MSSASEKPPVKYVRLGKTGLRISIPIVGCMSFGSSEWQEWVINEDKALPLLKAAWDRGVTTFDTANVYSNGRSEEILAKFMKMNNIPREKVVIFTKCHFPVGEAPNLYMSKHPELINTRDYVNQSGLSRAAIFNAVEKSLERLETSYIDLYQIHRYDPNTPAEETMSALNDLVRSGKVRYIGASSMFAWQFAEYNHAAEKNGWSQFVSMQNHYHLLYREEEREMIPYCLHKDRVLQEDDSDSDKEIINRVEELAKKYNVPMAQIAMAWILTKVSSPIIGMSSPTRLEDAILSDLTLTPEEIKSLEAPYAVKKIEGHA
ncbi:hypothetical protein FRB96_000594 [Tulasnella sp. 330]|nr:hypothetical protein FRB96_000594 [Tulasnella sp. 330]